MKERREAPLLGLAKSIYYLSGRQTMRSNVFLSEGLAAKPSCRTFAGW